MPTMLDASSRAAILTRFDQLRTDSAARWGKMNAPQMLAHVSDAMRMSLGDLAVRPKHMPIMRLFPFKQLIIYVLPFPKNVPTADELSARAPHSFERELADVKTLIARLDPARGEKRADAHPVFGRMSNKDWGQLGYNHLDHHLRQFGV
jgi:Protein of unknown function (DUF1569)